MNKKKIFMTISLSILIVTTLVSAVTYAWYTWNTTTDQETKIVTSLGAARVFFDSGANITGVNLRPTETKEEGIVKKITVRTSKETAYKISFNLYLDVISLDVGLNHASFKYELYEKEKATAVAQGNFLNVNLQPCSTNATSHIELIVDKTITTTLLEYTLYIWIDGTMDNPESMHNQNFNFKLHADGQNAIIGETLVQHINSLYTPNDTALNNGITYNLDTTHSLMNDRLGTSNVGLDNGNIRYYGAKPNNYIDIGDTEINSNGEEVPTLYRIIGLFKDMTVVNDDNTTEQKDLVKVIRNELIGDYSWDQSSSGVNGGNGVNEWSQADIMKLLNPNYDNEEVGGSLYWNSKSGNCYGYANGAYTSIPCDFTNVGLSAGAKNKIETVKWNLGGWGVYDIYPNQIYEYERGENAIQNPGDGIVRTNLWSGKIALLYPSDYGYAANLGSCDRTLIGYSNCNGVNWMYNLVTSNGKSWSWLLTPGTSSASNAWYVAMVGRIDGSYYDYDYVYDDGAIFPVFYLDAELGIVAGDGTIESPYVVQ